jgi:hypothetical protein
MVLGFPNDNSRPGFIRKLGWSDISDIPTLRLDTAKSGPAAASEARQDNAFLLDYSSAALSGSFVASKSREFLRWRYHANPKNSYTNLVIEASGRVSSYLIYKRFGSQLDLVDFQPRTKDEADVLLRQVIGAAQSQSVEALNIWAPSHHFVHECCIRAGFIASTPVTHFGGRILAEGSSEPVDFRQFSNWYLQMGDSDVY